MNLFSTLFGTPTEKDLKRKFKDIQKETEQRMRPLGNIGMAIIKASDYCSTEMKAFIDDDNNTRRQEKEVYLLYEFVYFFMHMTMRYAFGRLSEPQIGKLQGSLGPIIVGTAIDSFFLHWPEDLKEKMRSEFYENLNNAELEYGTSKELLSKDEPFTGESLISKLARNVTEAIGDNMNPATMTTVVSVTINALIDIKLDQLICRVAPALDQLTDDDLATFSEYLKWQHQ